MDMVHTKNAPAAIGTYSQAMVSGNTVYLSGQIPLDPTTMSLVSDDIKLQIVQVFENLSAVCEAVQGSLSNIAKLNIYLTDLTHFPHVNEIMTRFFQEPYPARAVIGVMALPKGAKIEVDGIMVL